MPADRSFASQATTHRVCGASNHKCTQPVTVSDIKELLGKPGFRIKWDPTVRTRRRIFCHEDDGDHCFETWSKTKKRGKSHYDDVPHSVFIPQAMSSAGKSSKAETIGLPRVLTPHGSTKSDSSNREDEPSSVRSNSGNSPQYRNGSPSNNDCYAFPRHSARSSAPHYQTPSQQSLPGSAHAARYPPVPSGVGDKSASTSLFTAPYINNPPGNTEESGYDQRSRGGSSAGTTERTRQPPDRSDSTGPPTDVNGSVDDLATQGWKPRPDLEANNGNNRRRRRHQQSIKTLTWEGEPSTTPTVDACGSHVPANLGRDDLQGPPAQPLSAYHLYPQPTVQQSSTILAGFVPWGAASFGVRGGTAYDPSSATLFAADPPGYPGQSMYPQQSLDGAFGGVTTLDPLQPSSYIPQYTNTYPLDQYNDSFQGSEIVRFPTGMSEQAYQSTAQDFQPRYGLPHVYLPPRPEEFDRMRHNDWHQ